MGISGEEAAAAETWVAAFEASTPQAKELARRLESADVDVRLAKPPAKACCSGGCGCGGKLQISVLQGDLDKVQQLLRDDWLEAVKRETGVEGAAVPVRAAPDAAGNPDAVTCPACGTTAALKEGACSDCGLQLE